MATKALIKTKIKDRLFFVNPKTSEVLGKKCYASVKDIPENIDYAVIAVSTQYVPAVLAECIEKGVRAAQIYTAGYSETGIPERAQMEADIKKIAKGKIRLIGPNCMGLYCPKSGLATIPESPLDEGPVGVISQSGSVLESFAYFSHMRNIRFSKIISYGNAIDLDCPDFLDYLADDPDTKVIAMYIEGTKNGEHLKPALINAARKKPVVAIKGGMTAHGGRVANSHTGSLAGSPIVWDALFRQAGVVQVHNFRELMNTAIALAYSPLPAGKRLSMITNSGGFSVIQTDLCESVGLEVPRFGEQTLAKLRKYIPLAGTSIGNPLDAYPVYFNLARGLGGLIDIVETITADGNIDSMVFQFDQLRYLRRILGDKLDSHMKTLIPLMVEACQYVREKVGKPVIICVTLDPYSEDEEDRGYNLELKKAFDREKFPVYPSLEDGVNALANLYRYSEWVRGG